MSARRLRSRRQQRGAAAVEGAITATLFVLTFACLLSAVGFASTKLEVMKEARAAAWRQALDHCEERPSAFDAAQREVTRDAAGEGPGSEDAYVGMAEQLESDGNSVIGKGSAVFTNPRFLGAESFQVTNRIEIRCNENVQNDTLWEAIRSAMRSVNPLKRNP
jgi:hypothetical protein